MNESDLLLKRNYVELKEWEAILEKADQFFQGVRKKNNIHLIFEKLLQLLFISHINLFKICLHWHCLS